MGHPEKPGQEERFKVHQPHSDPNRLMTVAELKILEHQFKQAAERTLKRVNALRDERTRCAERLRQIDEELRQLEGDLKASSLSPNNIPSLPDIAARPRRGSPNPKGRGRDPNSLPSRVIALLPSRAGQTLNTRTLIQALGLPDEQKTRASLSSILADLKNRGLLDRMGYGEYTVLAQPAAAAAAPPTAEPSEPPAPAPQPLSPKKATD